MGSTKYFIVISMIAILGVAWYRYDQYVIRGNYLVLANVSCDPTAESCFVADCSSDEDSECDDTPYMKVEVLSFEAPSCLKEHSCEAFVCTSESCTITTCSGDVLEEGEVCTIEEPVPEEVMAEEDNEETLEESGMQVMLQ